MDQVETLVVALLVLLSLLLICYSGLHIRSVEGFGMDDRPFEPDNTLLHRNPWDDVDYIKPEFVV